jgi:hypothetical protein
MVDAERAVFLRARGEGRIDEEVASEVLRELDPERCCRSADATARGHRITDVDRSRYW